MVTVFETSVIDAPIDKVWEVVRGFNDLQKWHPAIAKGEIEGGLDPLTIGCIRNFYLQDGENIRETLLAFSDIDYTFTYDMLTTGLGLFNYLSTMELRPITDGDRTYIQWSAEFTTAPGEEKEKADMVANGVFQGGFAALKEHFAQ
ncbi:MAG: SRPBCC family protein [Alphaproteobacteria bacterium]|nr:SRPBCC family protein [Alphaproteobacteria bacterium]HPF46104.1 SRPBCC family protein [Emcibacteraceae bacterium]HRW30156.1 SRPBCC family protein [Emcibacteraceae bacterium]